jgi:hypothetical protein
MRDSYNDENTAKSLQTLGDLDAGSSYDEIAIEFEGRKIEVSDVLSYKRLDLFAPLVPGLANVFRNGAIAVNLHHLSCCVLEEGKRLRLTAVVIVCVDRRDPSHHSGQKLLGIGALVTENVQRFSKAGD